MTQLGLSTSQSQTLSQAQVLSPQQLQGLQLLQMNSLELSQHLSQKMVLNPALRVENQMEVASGNLLEEVTERPANETERQLDALEHDDSLWDVVTVNYRAGEDVADVPSSSTWTPDDEERRRHFFDSRAAPQSMGQLLHDQVADAAPDEGSPLRRACEAVVSNLNHDGWLTATDEELARDVEVPLEVASQAVSLVQRTFEPAGIGGRTLREVFLLQLDRANEHGSLAYELADRHLEELSRNRIGEIAEAMDVEVEEVYDARRRLSELTPCPAAQYDQQPVQAILPDVRVIRGRNGHWRCEAVDAAFPKVSVEPSYLAMPDKKALKWKDTPTSRERSLAERIQEVEELIDGLEFRKRTIERIADQLLILQHDYFEGRTPKPRPLNMETVAERLNLNVSTVSRAVAGKYLETPSGVVAFKDLFPASNKMTVQDRIREIIGEEDKRHPLSDEKISQRLKAEGFENVERRTVTKYRKLDHIEDTSRRRVYR